MSVGSKMIQIMRYNARKAIKERGWVRCGICGGLITDRRDLTIDHIMPKKYGGTGAFDNIQLAHSSCNSIKGHKVNFELTSEGDK